MDPVESIALDVGPGQTVVMHSDLLHCSGPNRSAHDRLAFMCGYVGADTQYLDDGVTGDVKLPIFRSA